jgi:hypothetical protein
VTVLLAALWLWRLPNETSLDAFTLSVPAAGPCRLARTRLLLVVEGFRGTHLLHHHPFDASRVCARLRAPPHSRPRLT